MRRSILRVVGLGLLLFVDVSMPAGTLDMLGHLVDTYIVILSLLQLGS